MKKRVAIIGAGPCGLSQLRAFQQAESQGADIPELVCFERQSDWGGLWHYTWRTGPRRVRGAGALQHVPVPVGRTGRRSPWSFGDYSFEDHFGKPIPSFPPYAVLNSYILGRAERSDIRRYVRFRHRGAPRRLVPRRPSGFTVRSTDLAEQSDREEEFDHVVVATGPFLGSERAELRGDRSLPRPGAARPRLPRRAGVQGQAPAHRRQQLLRGGTSRFRTSSTARRRSPARTAPVQWAFKWPEGIEELPLVARFEGSTAPLQGRQHP